MGGVDSRVDGIFMAAMASFASGVAVVTTRDRDGVFRGLTATSLVSYSSRPPSVLICIDRTSVSYRALTECECFAVMLLAADQEGVARVFASKDPDKFEQIPWEMSQEGLPILRGAIAHLVCTSSFVVAHGDHAVLIGHVTDGAMSAAPPLVYWNRSFYQGLE